MLSTKLNTKKLALAAVFVALGVVCSAFYIPVGVAKCFPAQHFINVVAGVFLGPGYAVAMAFVTSLIRVTTGMGSLLAFPGSMIGALLCGLLYKYTKNTGMAFLGEVIGTGVIGALVAYPVAAMFLSGAAAFYAFVIPFSVSSFGGAVLSMILIVSMKKIGIFNLLRTEESQL